ncbi:MAG: hypothetical protein ACRD1C_07250 [Terriglobales bacterium]
MDQILHQLGHLLFDSIPTIVLFVALHYYLKWVLYRPLRHTLAERRERTEGRRLAAEKILSAAEQKLAGYEASLRQRHLDNYKLIEARRQEGLALGQTHIAAARQEAGKALVAARQELAQQSTEVHKQLHPTAEGLARQIVAQVLRPERYNQPLPGVGA